METTLTPHTILLTATFGELVQWERQGLAVYATPTPESRHYAAQVYVAAAPTGREDFLVADVQDFLTEAGEDAHGWEDMSACSLAAREDEVFPLCVPRMQRVDER